MNIDPNSAQMLLHAAMQALKNGDRTTARHLAEQAAALAPHSEEPWLLLSFLASHKAALYYLERALQANPASRRALAAREWLKKQSVENPPPAVEDQPPAPAVQEQPLSPPPAGAGLPAAPAAGKPGQSGSAARRILRYSAMLVVTVVVLLGLVALGGSPRPAESQDDVLVSIVQTVLKSSPTEEPTHTPSLTWTIAPTSTPTIPPTATATHTASPTPTATASPTPTHTSTPTASPTATPLPSPTPTKIPTPANTYYKVVPGDTLMLIAQRHNVSIQNLIAANNLPNPSLIRAGQVLTIPAAGQSSASSQPTPGANPASTGGQGKEIHIDISEQRLYAYQDGKLVFNLVVSTGIGNSTRIGTFKVLDKIPNAYSNAFNIWMPYWMGIYYSGTLENGIHGLPKLWNGVELWGNLLGRPATYGCIESKTSEAKALYEWAEIGTPVIIRR